MYVISSGSLNDVLLFACVKCRLFVDVQFDHKMKCLDQLAQVMLEENVAIYS